MLIELSCTYWAPEKDPDYELIKLIVSIVAPLLAMGVTVFVLYRQQTASIAHSKASLVLQFLKHYLDISKERTEAAFATDEKKEQLSFDYWRSLMDLQWAEYHLWLEGYIKTEQMTSWSFARYNEYNGFSNHNPSEKEHPLKKSYKETWVSLCNTNYFSKDEKFVSLMNGIHEKGENFDEIRKLLDGHIELIKNSQ